uniref:Uncharacterized protein n=1 Tax=Plectus sambesii TaxID=2011161 RepID=A0A914W3Z1_9BILA
MGDEEPRTTLSADGRRKGLRRCVRRRRFYRAERLTYDVHNCFVVRAPAPCYRSCSALNEEVHLIQQQQRKTRRRRSVSGVTEQKQQEATTRQSPQKKRQLPRRSTRYNPQQQHNQSTTPMQHWPFMSAAGLPHPSGGIFPSTPSTSSPFYHQHATTASYMGVPAVFQGHVFLPQPFFGMPISGAPMGPPTYAGIVPNLSYPTLSTEDYARIIAPKNVENVKSVKNVTINDAYSLPPLTKAKQLSQPTPPPPTKSTLPKPLSTKKSASVGGACERKAPANAAVAIPKVTNDRVRLPAGKELINDRSTACAVMTPLSSPLSSPNARPARASVESAINRLISKNQQQSHNSLSACSAPERTATTSLANDAHTDSASLKRKQRAPRKRGGVPLLKPADDDEANSGSIAISPLPKCDLLEPLEKMPKLELQTSIDMTPDEYEDVKETKKKSRKAVKIVSNWKPVGVGSKRFVYLNNDTKPVKRVCYKSAKHKREPETIREGDCVVINSGDDSVDGHIGKVTRIFVDPETDRELWSRGDESYNRRDRMPREDTPGELVFFCRRVYDFKGKRVVRNRS